MSHELDVKGTREPNTGPMSLPSPIFTHNDKARFKKPKWEKLNHVGMKKISLMMSSETDWDVSQRTAVVVCRVFVSPKQKTCEEREMNACKNRTREAGTEPRPWTGDEITVICRNEITTNSSAELTDFYLGYLFLCIYIHITVTVGVAVTVIWFNSSNIQPLRAATLLNPYRTVCMYRSY